MLLNKFKDIPIVLGSQSPRRKELMQKMGFDFQVIVKETDEHFDKQQSPREVVEHIATNKIQGFDSASFHDTLVITADTIVVHQDEILGKPGDEKEAFEMLNKLQGAHHVVLTAVALQYQGKLHSFVEETQVEFYPLSAEEIIFYMENYHPFDKAGSYGIQEWIGFIGVKSITGPYENVVGLPTARLYQEMKKI
ncbi:Maf family nucleotide pyrophosphatase [Sphingobacterium chuzhouense]|uniref:dTTP/UTP pyrophosphatase n=1 Tax=Sphingobacterium chuzhouense TaxID=1742264 RepID=A0ABR7XMA0_9SPHI|nr:Maf family protein [Sphingobacterium chuzhouense]MBD1420293.1 septum formation protein Maf [Sphingobacterium chuzhouense]